MPSYAPQSTSTLRVKLGNVDNAAVQLFGSPNLAAALAFTAADVDAQVLVFGAGFKVISAVRSVTDSGHVVLYDAAPGDINPGTAIVFRPYKCRTDAPITINTSLGVKDTAAFTIQSLDGSFRPVRGQNVVIIDDVLGARFGGIIDSVKVMNAPGSPLVWSECQCIGFDYLLYKRTAGTLTGSGTPANPDGGVFSGFTAGDIVTYLVDHAAGGDGLTNSVIPGPTVDVVTFDYSFTAGSAIDSLIQLINGTSSDIYYYYVDPWRTVVFKKLSTTSAPWNISTSDGSDANVLIQVANTTDGAKLANRAFLDLGMYIADAVEDDFTGDGTTRTWDVIGNPVALEPVITLDLGSGPVAQTVGIDGVDTGKDYYWTSNSNTIRQDSGATVLPSPSGGFPILAVTYQGFTDKVIGPSIDLPTLANNPSIDARAAVEGGTGFYDTYVTVSTASTLAGGTALGTSLVQYFGDVPSKLEVQSYRGGLQPGQNITIDLPEIGASGTYMVFSVSLDCGGNLMLWTYELYAGALIGDWRQAFKNLSGGSGGSAGGLSTGTPGAPGAPGATGAPGGVPPLMPTAVSASDHDTERRKTPTGGVETPIYVLTSLPSGSGAEWQNVWFDDGTDKRFMGSWAIADPIKFWVFAPVFNALTHCKVSVTTSSSGGTNDPATAVASSDFTIAIIALPGSNLISALSLNVRTGTAWNDVTLEHTPDGTPFWGIPDGIQITCGAADANGWYLTFTGRVVNASGTPAPAEQGGLESEHIAEFDYIAGAVFTATNVDWWEFNPPGSAFTKMRFEFWGYRRPGASTLDRVLQVLPGGLTYLDVTFGAPPAGALDPTRMAGGVIPIGVSFPVVAQPTLVVSSEKAVARTPGLNGQTGLIVTTTITAAGSTATYADAWLSKDAGVSWQYEGQFHYASGANVFEFKDLAPTVDANGTASPKWIVKVLLSNASSVSDPVFAVSSTAFTVLQIAAAGANVCSNAHLGTAGYTKDADGNWSFAVPVTWDIALTAEAWTTQLQVRNVDVSRSPMPGQYGQWKVVDEQDHPGETVTSTNIVGWPVLAAAFQYKYYEFQLLARSRSGTSSTAWVVQTTAWSGAAFLDFAAAVQATALPSSTGVTGVVAGTYSNKTRADGSQYAQISPTSYTDPTGDVNANFVRITVQVTDAAGNPAPGKSAGSGDQGGDEVAHSGAFVTGGSHSDDGLSFGYNPAGSIYHYMRYKFYVLNRLANNANDFLNTGTMSTLQTALTFSVNFGDAPRGVAGSPSTSGAASLPLITGITIVSGGLYVKRSRPDGSQYALIQPFIYTDPNANTDPNAAYTTVTVQCVNSFGSPAPSSQGGTEVFHCGGIASPVTILGGVPGIHSTPGLAFDFNPPGAPGGPFTFMRFRFYCLNRLGTHNDDWKSTGVISRLQLSFDVAFGGDTSLGDGLWIDPDTGQRRWATGNPATSLLRDWDFSLSSPGPVTAATSVWSAAGGTSEFVHNDSDGNGNYVRLTGVGASLTQSFKVVAGQNLVYTYWIRSQSVAGPLSSVMTTLNFYDGDGNFISTGGSGLGANAFGPTAWASPSMGTPIVPPAKSATCIISCAVTATGPWDVGKFVLQPR